jgi:hypothetical protein
MPVDLSQVPVPDDLAAVAGEKGIPLDLIKRALILKFPAEQIKQQLALPDTTLETTEAFIKEQERIAAGGEITIPPDLAEIASAKGWPEDLIKRAIKLGAQTDFMIQQINAGITPEIAEQFIAQQEAAREAGGLAQTLDLSWMRVPTEWGIRVKAGKKGLGVGDINVGTYADIPDVWPYHTEMPRGAYPIPGVPSMGYTIYEKAELWADNSADLYEEAIQRRWRPSTDIDWNSIEPLPDEIERAMCQFCTYICENALLMGDMTGRWLPEMSYGYHEVKLYLSTAAFDYARFFEVFRKRALSNGGGMGIQSPGYFHRGIIDCRSWTEVSVVMHILSTSHLMGVFQMGEYFARNEAESQIFRFCIQDAARQLAYGTQHLKYFLLKHDERRKEVQHFLNKAEAIYVYEEEKDTPFREAQIVLLGGGTSPEQLKEGMLKLDYFTKRWLNQYVERLASASLYRRERLQPALRKYIQEPEAETAEAAA